MPCSYAHQHYQITTTADHDYDKSRLPQIMTASGRWHFKSKQQKQMADP